MHPRRPKSKNHTKIHVMDDQNASMNDFIQGLQAKGGTATVEPEAMEDKEPKAEGTEEAAAVHGNTCLASAFTEMLFEKPSSRRSRIAIEPNKSPMPTMWMVSTEG